MFTGRMTHVSLLSLALVYSGSSMILLFITLSLLVMYDAIRIDAYSSGLADMYNTSDVDN